MVHLITILSIMLSFSAPISAMYFRILQRFAQDITTKRRDIKKISDQLIQTYSKYIGIVRKQKKTPELFGDLEIRLIIEVSRRKKPKPPLQPKPELFLVPKDQLDTLGLCPLFIKLRENPLYTTILKEDYSSVSHFHEEQSPLCIIPLGGSRFLMQLESLSQMELAIQKKVAPALCGGLSLHNCILIRKYAKTGNKKYLQDMHNFDLADQFITDIGLGSWLLVSAVKKYLTIAQKKKYNVSAISVISSPLLFDSQLKKRNDFEMFIEKADYKEVQQLKKYIMKGLQQPNFVHVIIVGNEELVEPKEARGHFFIFAIIKVGGITQYIVLDTSQGAYHLDERSYARLRLNFMIDQFEKGQSDIMMPHLRWDKYTEQKKIRERLENIIELPEKTDELKEIVKMIERYAILSGDQERFLQLYLNVLEKSGS